MKKERLISSRRANIPIKLYIKATKHVPGHILFQTVQLSSNKWPITLTLQLCWGVFLVIPRSEIKLKNIYLFYIKKITSLINKKYLKENYKKKAFINSKYDFFYKF